MNFLDFFKTISVKAQVEARDRVKDVCVKCGKEIIYDKEDGYWDSFEKEENGIFYYNLSCDKEHRELHEPTNFKRGDLGLYFRK